MKPLFFISLFLAFYAPMYAAAVSGSCANNVVRSSGIKIALEDFLTHELNDAAIAKELSIALIEDILSWKVPTIAPAQVDSIIAYAFGNRILSNGNRVPGPMNDALADLVVQLHKETNAPVYVQWEITEAIGDRIAPDKVISINPILDAQANIVYLSTAGVASAIVKQVGSAQKLGKVAVIAFNDHLFRCIQTSRDAGIDAYAPAGYTMPSNYDSQSGQPWTRNRFTYLVTDIKARIGNYLEKIMGNQK
jgi:hypothetical protein